MTPTKKEGRPARRRSQSQHLRRRYALLDRLQAGWAQEGDRIFSEYQRTRSPAHLRAWCVHVAAMAASTAPGKVELR